MLKNKTLLSYSTLERLFVLVIAAVLLLTGLSIPTALGYSKNDVKSVLNQTPFYDPTATIGGSCGAATTTLVGADNPGQAYNYFVQKGLTSIEAAAIVGNFFEESNGVNPKINQNGGGAGRGIAQWSVDGRWQGVIALAAKESTPGHVVEPTDLAVQLDFVWQELQSTYAFVLPNLKAATTIEDATNQFMGPGRNRTGGATGGYEDPGTPHLDVRITDAKLILTKYGGGGAGGPSGCDQAVNCTGGGASASGLSPLRQNVVCIAQQELAIWKKGVQKNEYCKKYIGGLGQSAWCEEWCADFSSWVYDQAKYPLHPDPNWRVPAVQGIWDIGKAGGKFHYHDADSYKPIPGDLVIHKNGESHVNIVVAVAGNTITMIGGDQGGPNYGGPNSTSVVSEYQAHSSNDDGITGYVSPD